MKRSERGPIVGRWLTRQLSAHCGDLAAWSLVLVVLAVGLAPSLVQAQYQEYPRLGLSLAPDHYEREIEVAMDEPFEVHVVATGYNDNDPLPFDVAALRWAIYQACCGSDLEILSVTYDEQLEHIGDPFGGVLSSSEICVPADFLHIASVTVVLHALYAGTYFVAGGPTDWATNCDNENVTMMDLPIEVTVTEVTPSNQSSWSTVKGLYR